MNPNMELEEIINRTVEEFYGPNGEVLSVSLYQNIRDWMSRNQIIFYQP